jgi:hypothetical membrane protein
MSIRWLGIFGLVAPCVGLSMVLFATTQAPWFSWQENALSDLGVRETALLFNAGLILAGALALPLAASLWSTIFRDPAGRLGTGMLAFACISLVLIGVFTEDAGRIHYWVSVAFFTSLPLAMLVFGVSMFLNRSATNPIHLSLTVILAIIAALAWAMPHDGVAIPEIISSAAGSLWFVVFGFRVLTYGASRASPKAGL